MKWSLWLWLHASFALTITVTNAEGMSHLLLVTVEPLYVSEFRTASGMTLRCPLT